MGKKKKGRKGKRRNKTVLDERRKTSDQRRCSDCGVEAVGFFEDNLVFFEDDLGLLITVIDGDSVIIDPRLVTFYIPAA